MSDEIIVEHDGLVRFGMVPKTVVGLPAELVHVYVGLALYANVDRRSRPSLTTLANDMHIDRSTVVRRINRLVEAGFVRREEVGSTGSATVYLLLGWSMEEAPDGSRTHAPSGVGATRRTRATRRAGATEGRGRDGDRRMGATPTDQGTEDTPSPSDSAPQTPSWLPERVNRKPVTREERDLCDDVLAAFNVAAETSYGGAVTHRTAIVGRIREHPELTIQQHAWIIETAFLSPWWSGTPAPPVIYGNSGVFDQALQAAKDRAEGVRRERSNGGGPVSRAEQVTAGTDRLRQLAAARRQETAA